MCPKGWLKHETCPWDGAMCPGKQGLRKEVFTVSGCQLLTRYWEPRWLYPGSLRPASAEGLYPAERMVFYLCVWHPRETPGMSQPISESPGNEINCKDSGRKRSLRILWRLKKNSVCVVRRQEVPSYELLGWKGNFGNRSFSPLRGKV